MQKIAFLINSLSKAGGTERVTTQIANALESKNYKVYLFTIEKCSNAYFGCNENIKIINLFDDDKNGVKKLLSGIIYLRKLIKIYSIETVVSVDTILSLYAIPASFFLSIKLISWEHFNFNSDLGKKSRQYSRFISAFYSDNIVVLTDQDKKNWSKNIPLSRNKVITIKNPTSFSVEKTYKDSSKIVLCVGRLVKQKGFDLMLKAWCLIHNLTDWELHIIGDGEELDNLNNVISSNEISNAKIFPATKNIKENFSSAGIFVLPSRFEGYVLVLLESLSLGIPSIAFDCETGPKEIIINDCGVLVEPENYEKLSLEILRLINSFELRECYSEAAIKRAEAFTIDQIIKEWEVLIEK